MRSIKKTAKIRVEFTGKNITPFGGIGLFSKFIRKLETKEALDNISGIKTVNIGKKIVSIVYGFVCGLDRPSDTEVPLLLVHSVCSSRTILIP